MIHLSLFTKLSKEEWDALPDYEKIRNRAKHYVEDEIFIDIEWVMAYKEWLKIGKIGPEPRPHFDYMERQFNGCDVLNAFMKGVQFGEDLANNSYSK